MPVTNAVLIPENPFDDKFEPFLVQMDSLMRDRKQRRRLHVCNYQSFVIKLYLSSKQKNNSSRNGLMSSVRYS